MQVEISAEAERDLRDIARYLAQDDPGAALAFVATLREACKGLSQFPRRFPIVRRYEREEVRHRAVGNYLIFYRIDEARVVVLHVLHGATDYEPLDRR